MTDDPLDEGIPRDGYGRPLIIPVTRGKPNLKAKPVGYTRASTFASALDDGRGLTNWKVHHAVAGIACSPDLAAMVAAFGRNVNAYSAEDKRNLDAIIDTAHDRSGGNDKANYGTAVHTLTEPGRDPLAIDEDMARDVAAYDRLVEYLDVDVEATEVFTVNDELQVAGTFDHAYRLRADLTVDDVTIPAGTALIGDKKTGTLHLDQHAIQLAVYARGKKYDHVTGERTALDVSPQWGLAVRIARGEGKAVAYLVDLHAGYVGAKLAAEVRAYRSGKSKLGRVVADMAADTPAPRRCADGSVDQPLPLEPTETPGVVVNYTVKLPTEIVDPTVGEAINNLNNAGLLHPDQPDAVMHLIQTADSPDALHAVWRANRAAWTDAYTAAAKKRAGKFKAAA